VDLTRWAGVAPCNPLSGCSRMLPTRRGPRRRDVADEPRRTRFDRGIPQRDIARHLGTKRVTTSWLFATFGDSGSVRHNSSSRAEDNTLEHP
jgi:hypothetical protein